MENDFFFVKSFNSRVAQLFVNKYILPLISKAIPGSSRFFEFNYLLRTDFDFDQPYHGGVNIKFTYQKKYFHTITEDEFDLIEIFIDTADPIDDDTKVVGGMDPSNRALCIRSWKCGTWVPEESPLSMEDKLLNEISEFIEITSFNTYKLYENRYLKMVSDHYKFINNHYDKMYDHIKTEPQDDFYCQICHKSPCQCSDSDPE